MGFVDRIAGGLEMRSGLAEPEEWLFDAWGGPRTSSGERVTVRKAFGHPAVYAAITLIAGTVGAMPLRLYRGQGRDKQPAPDAWQWDLLHDEPNDEDTTDIWVERLLGHECGWGNFYAEKEKARVKGRNVVGGLWPISPDRVEVERDEKTYEKKFHITGTARPLTETEILHIPAFGYDGTCGLSPIRIQRETIGLALARLGYEADFYKNDGNPGGVIQMPEGKKLSDGGTRLGRQWDSRHAGRGNRRSTAVLEDGAQWQQIGLPLVDLQFIENSRYSVNQVASIFQVPPEMIGGSRDQSMVYSTVGGQALHLVKFGLTRWLIRVERALKRDRDLFPLLPAKQAVYPKFVVEGLLRGDTRERTAYYAVMRKIKAMSANEVRELEDMSPRDGGDDYDDLDTTDVPEPPADGGGQPEGTGKP